MKLKNHPAIYNAALFFITALFCAAIPATAAERTGIARVLDGQRLALDGKPIRLYGIAAPDLRQNCAWPGKTIPCGEIAKTAMMDLVAGARKIVCREKTGIPHPETLAICFADGFDIGANMVHTGWALAEPKMPSDYASIEAAARNKNRGLWKGDFVRPWAWRPDDKSGGP